MISLNLLPETRKQAFALRHRLVLWRGVMILIFLGAVFSVGAVATMDWLLSRQLVKADETLATWHALSAKRESGQVQSITERLNATITGLNGLFGPLAHQTSTISDLFASMPTDVSVTSATFDPEGKFTVTGVAASRASFLALRSALETSPAVSSVTTTSTASQRENLPFEYTGQLKLKP